MITVLWTLICLQLDAMAVPLPFIDSLRLHVTSYANPFMRASCETLYLKSEQVTLVQLVVALFELYPTKIQVKKLCSSK